MKGSGRWKEGTETCVFKPSVACVENFDTYPSGMPGKISRLMEKNVKDIEIEQFLKEHFSHLVKRGFLAVMDIACTPRFKKSNIRSPLLSQDGPCSKIKETKEGKVTGNFVNLITTEYTADVDNYLKYQQNNIFFGMLGATMLFRGAICAAIDLVPDDKPWVIHFDLHSKNVLVMDGPVPYTALADWGRAFIIDIRNPKDIFWALHFFLLELRKKYSQDSSFEYKQLAQAETTQTYLQFVPKVIESMDKLYNEYRDLGLALNKGKATVDPKEPAITGLRGLMVFILVRALFVSYFPSRKLPEWLDSLLKQTSQAGLIQVINAHLPKINGEEYYTKEFTGLKNKQSVTIEQYNNNIFPVEGGKRKKTRKRNNKSKSLKHRR